MSSNENNSEVAVDKVGEEKSGVAKSDLKGAKRAAEVSAHVKLYVFVLDARHFIERYYMRYFSITQYGIAPRGGTELRFAAIIPSTEAGVFLDS